MLGTGDVVFKVSKEAFKKVAQGIAEFSSGGIREIGTGRLIELAKPTLSSKLSTLTSGTAGSVIEAVNAASSVASNVQCAFIQKGVTLANQKLDLVVNAMQGLKTISALSLVNTVFGLANCGISVAGFNKTISKLDNLDNQLGAFASRYEADQDDERIQEFNTHKSILTADRDTLRQISEKNEIDILTFKQKEATIERNIIKAYQYLKKIVTAFEERRIDGRIGCQIIFTLSDIITATLNDFCCLYYFVHDRKTRPCYKEWVEVLEDLQSTAFREHLKDELFCNPENAPYSSQAKKSALLLAEEGIADQHGYLTSHMEVIESIEISDFSRIDEILNERLIASLEAQNPDHGTYSISQRLENAIKSNAYVETDDGNVLISIGV